MNYIEHKILKLHRTTCESLSHISNISRLIGHDGGNSISQKALLLYSLLLLDHDVVLEG